MQLIGPGSRFELAAGEGTDSGLAERLSMMKPFLQRNPLGDSLACRNVSTCGPVTALAIFSLTCEQHIFASSAGGRNKIHFHVPLSPDKLTKSLEPCALKHLGPFPFCSVDTFHSLPPVTLGLCYCSAPDYTLLPNCGLESPGTPTFNAPRCSLPLSLQHRRQ